MISLLDKSSDQSPATVINENLHALPKKDYLLCTDTFLVNLALFVPGIVDYHVDLVLVPVVKVHV
jgi:hypothetical protein